MARKSFPYLIAIPCRLMMGSFSGERYFSLQLASNEIYASVAPKYFCWVDNHLVEDDQPSQETEGLIAAKFRDYVKEGIVRVEVPDGETIEVTEDQIKERPTEIVPPPFKPYVSVQS
jgi:hypothetical protein